MTAYDQIMITRRVHPMVYWFTASTLYFVLEESIFRAFGEHGFFWTRFIITYVVLAGVPTFTVMMSRSFKGVIQDLQSLIELPEENVDRWILDKLRVIFSFDTPLAKCIVILTLVFANLIAFIVGFPFSSNTFNILNFVILQPLLIIAGQSAYIVIASLRLLYQIVRYPLKSSFYKPGRLSTASLSNTFSLTAMVALAFYLLHALAIWFTPFRLNVWIITWGIVTAFFPLALFLWSFFQVHLLIRRIKIANIDAVNQQVQVTFSRLQSQPTKEQAELLNQMMEIQNKVEQTGEWPISKEEITTYLDC